MKQTNNGAIRWLEELETYPGIGSFRCCGFWLYQNALPKRARDVNCSDSSTLHSICLIFVVLSVESSVVVTTRIGSRFRRFGKTYCLSKFFLNVGNFLQYYIRDDITV